MRKRVRLVFAGLLVLSSLLLGMPVAASAQQAAVPSVTVLVSALHVRQGPGTNYPISGMLQAGTQATVIGRSAAGDWYQVHLADGSTGWVSGATAYVQVSGDPASVPVVAAPALPPAVLPVTGSSGAGHGGPPNPAALRAGAGGTIVFQTSSGGAIYIINADGTGLRHLTDGIDPALSPDGQWVAFTRWDGSQTGAPGSLWVIKVDGSGLRQVMQGVDQPKSPSWSPDGTQIVVNMQSGGRVNDVRRCVPLGNGRPNIPQGSYDITIEGNQICFTVPADPHWGLRVVDVASGTYQDVPGDLHSFAPTWDPANSWHVVFQGGQGLFSLDVNRGVVWPLTTDPQDRGPVFSPDGQKIALSYWQNDHWEIHVMNADGSGEVRLTQTPLSVLANEEIAGQQPQSWNNAAPAWSPDGSQIAFLSDRSGQWEIWVMNADGSNQRALFPAGTLQGLSIQYHGVDERVISWR